MLELEKNLKTIFVAHCLFFIDKEKEILKGEFN